MLFLDLEATGTDPAHARIFEIALVRSPGGEIYRRWVNPGQAIPADVVELCRLDADKLGLIERSPPFGEVIPEVERFFEEPTWLGFNILGYDLPLLAEEFLRNGHTLPWEGRLVIDLDKVYKRLNPRNLNAFVLQYLGREHTDAHGALSDTVVLAEAWPKLLAAHPVLADMTTEQLALFSNYDRKMADPAGKLFVNDKGEVCFATRNNFGVPVAEDFGYARWMCEKDFPESTKEVLRRIMNKPPRDDEPNLFSGIEDDQPGEPRVEIPF